MTLLQYYKMILDKVSFDDNLFKKEYRKAIRHLGENEIDDLHGWLATRDIPSGTFAGMNNEHKFQLSNRPQLQNS